MNKSLVGISLLASVVAAPMVQAQGLTGDIGKRIEIGAFGQFTKLDEDLRMKKEVPGIGGMLAMQIWKGLGVEVNGNIGKTENQVSPFEKITYTPWRGLGTLTLPAGSKAKIILGAGYLQSVFNGRATPNKYEDGFAGMLGVKLCGSGKWGARADALVDYNPSPNQQALTGTSTNGSLRVGATYALRGACGGTSTKWDWALKIDPASATVNKGATKQFALSAADMKGKDIPLKNIKDLACTTSDAAIATVTNGAVATGVKYGTATITCSGTQKKLARSVSATVTVPPPAWNLTLTPTSGSTDVGKTLSFASKATDADNVDLGAITWSSANPAIASVNNGTVTCNAAGTTTITVSKTAYGSTKTASASVECKEVVKPAARIALDYTLFNFDKAQVLKSGMDTLKVVVEAMKRIPTLRISVEGHTDWYGSEAYNNKLAKSRADMVTKQILKLAGKDAKSIKDRIFTNSFGEQCVVSRDGASEPEPPPANRGKVSADNKQAQSPNRRVEVWQLLDGQNPPTSCRAPDMKAGRVSFGELR
jgi:outer membrane protein OmpA-like peptidoglycan-associated protein